IKKWRMKAGFNLPEAWKILKFAKRDGVQILHSHGYKFNLLMGIWPRSLRKAPLISTLHGYVGARKFTKMWLYELLDKVILKRTEAVVIVSAHMRSIKAVKKIKDNKIVLIENGIACDEGRSAKGELSQDVLNFIKKRNKSIGAVGRLSKEKGLENLIKALKIVVNENLDVGLLIVGEGSERSRLEKLVSTLNLEEHVYFSGYLSNPLDYMRFIDCLIMASLTEGLPITLLETMWVGTPVVATSVGGIPSVLAEGRYGVLVEPGNINQLAEAITKVLRADDLELIRSSEEGRKRIRECYSSQVMAEKY